MGAKDVTSARPEPLGEWLSQLSDDELNRLEGAATTPGFLRVSKAVMRQFRLPVEWAAKVNALADRGWTEALVIETLRAVRSARRQFSSVPPNIVSTQLGVSRVGFTDTPIVLRRLFEQAESEVLLAGFRVTDREILTHLGRPSWKALTIRLFVDLDLKLDGRGRKCSRRDPRSHAAIWWEEFLSDVWPSDVDRPSAWFAPSTLTQSDQGWLSMHVKCVVLDRRKLFLTSANFTDRGLFRNFELGVVLEDSGAAEAVIRHFDAQVEDGVFVNFPGVARADESSL